MILNVDLAIQNWEFDIAMLNDQRVSHWGWSINFVNDNSPSENRFKREDSSNHKDSRHCAMKPIAFKVWKTLRQRSRYHVLI